MKEKVLTYNDELRFLAFVWPPVKLTLRFMFLLTKDGCYILAKNRVSDLNEPMNVENEDDRV